MLPFEINNASRVRAGSRECGGSVTRVAETCYHRPGHTGDSVLWDIWGIWGIASQAALNNHVQVFVLM